MPAYVLTCWTSLRPRASLSGQLESWRVPSFATQGRRSVSSPAALSPSRAQT